jgi:hypothetical protein
MGLLLSEHTFVPKNTKNTPQTVAQIPRCFMLRFADLNPSLKSITLSQRPLSPGQVDTVSPGQPIVPGTGECLVCKARREAEAAKKARQRDRRRGTVAAS